MDTNRREFLKLTTSAGVGLSLGISLNGCNEWNTESLAFSPKAWLSIHTDNRVVITLPKIEMGQGIINAIPAIIAEELDLEWSTIEIKLADADTKHAQLRTSGSSSIKSLWLPLRTGAAGVRGMLLQAAAQTWEVDQQSLSTKNGQVINQQTGKHISYGDLSKLASTFHPPKNPALKKPSEFNFIGNKNPSLNVHDIVKGQAQYGIDTELENLHYAAITHAPTFKSTLASVSTTRQLSSGVKGIVKLNNAVAVVATSYWLAKNVLSTLNITWHSETDNDLNQAQIERDFIDALSHTGKLVKQFGNAFPSGEGISADYHSAYQAHACMEPINCTAHIHDDGCDVWAPTQHPMMALGAAREAYHTQLGKWSSKVLRKLGISDNVRVHTTLLGGGFGRRLEQDFVTEAVIIAKEFNFPVKLLWSREEDIQNDFYRPYSSHRIESQIDKGKITHWRHTASGASEGKISGGAIDFPYDIPNRSLYFQTLDHGIPIGSWRSVAYSNHVFATESFIDEIAHYENTDPFLFRQNLLRHDDRSKRLLEKLKEVSKWNWHLSKGEYIGIAFNRGFGSYIALTVLLNKNKEGITITEIHCVVDCGTVIDPDSVTAQIEGGILYGLNASLGHSITIQNNRIEQHNFDDYPLIKINETPKIYIEVIPSNVDPGGIGEIAVPIIAPAIANSVYSATGVRHRRTPFKL